MNLRVTRWIAPIALTCALVMVGRTPGQEQKSMHHHYKLIDLGTFGGPSGSVAIEPDMSVINRNGLIVGGADTSLPTPEPGCYNPIENPDCFVFHAFAWNNNNLTDLGTLPGGNYSFAFETNQHGLIAGVSENDQIDPAFGNPEFHAVLWQNGQIRDLGTLGGSASFAGNLNDLGQITGNSLNDVPDPFSILGGGGQLTLTQTHAFLWENDKMQDLGTLGGPDSWSVFINDAGQIAGASFTSYGVDPNTGTPPVGAFLWQNGKMKDLGRLGGDNGFLGPTGIVNGLNNRGEVTGGMIATGNQWEHAFLWNGEKLSDLGALGGNGSFARGINDAGEVTGLATLPGDQVNHGFLWKNGVMTDLGTLGSDPCSDALAVSATGQVVGASQSVAGGCAEWTTAFLWENGGPSVDLNSLVTSSSGEHLNVGLWVNGTGEIVAGGIPPGCDNAETCSHVYLLIPCDEKHPGIAGCDYSAVDATVAEAADSGGNSYSSGQTSAASTRSPFEVPIRFLRNSRNRSYATAALTMTSGAPPTGTVGITYGGTHIAPNRERYTGFVLNATGGVPPYTWTWAAARGSSLPPGLSISQVFFGGSTRCCFSAVVISGNPTKAGTYRVIVTVTDSESPAVHTSAVYAITIDAASEAATVEASPASAAPMVDSDSRQQYHHYKLVDMGTFGGPESYINGFEYQGAAQNVDNGGTLAGWADTSMPDPFASSGNAFGNFCFNPDCFVSHAFQFQNGVTTDLGTLPGGLNSASSWISANGIVAGTSQNGELDPLDAGFPEDQAVVWERGRITSLGSLPEGGYESGAQSVNSHGQAVGWAFNTVPDPNSLGMLSPFYDYYEPVYAYQMRAFLWENGAMKDLGTLGTGTDAWAMAINDKGQVMGISYTNATPNQVMTGCSSGAPMPTQDPFFWERGKMTDLGTLGGTCGTPFWMNDSAEIVGASDLAGDENAHAFLWTQSAGMRDLGTLGGSNSAASMVNESGVVAGGSFVAGGGNFHAFLWNGTMQDLGTLGGCAYAFAINARGQVVGNAGGDCETTSFLWEGVGPMANLNALVSPHVDLLVTGALNINDSGEIAGQATDMSGHSSAILLIPCDENHPNIEGCDYSMVDAATANEYQSPLQVAAPPAASQGTESPAEMMLRVRSMTASRNRRLGASPKQ